MLTSLYNILHVLILTSGWQSLTSGTVQVKRATKVQTSLIATFNIQNLGPKKASKPEVMEMLRQIMTRYDIIAVQEIQDKTQTAIVDLLQILNEGAGKSDLYAYILSDRVGDTIGEEEQYGLFYKPSKLKVLRKQHYDDQLTNYFSRVPFLTEVQYLTGKRLRFVIVNIHAKPDPTSAKATVQELDHLTDVYDYVTNLTGISDVLLVGDMNADGSYVRKRDWKNIRLRTEQRFHWLVSDDEDTTVGNSNNAYDRIIAAGDKLQAAILGSSANVYRFDEESSVAMTQMTKEEALDVSDHYPVEVEIRLN